MTSTWHGRYQRADGARQLSRRRALEGVYTRGSRAICRLESSGRVTTWNPKRPAFSGGDSEASSWFIGASESGNDAFIVTRAQLAPEDENDAFDVYDLRVGARRPVSAPACSGTGCQGVPAPPPTFATPPSATFNGVGNFPPPAEAVQPAAKPKVKRLTRAQQLAKALKVCHKKGAERTSCEATARRRYGSARRGK